MGFFNTGGVNMSGLSGATAGAEMVDPSNVIRVALPHDVSYHNLLRADGSLVARRIVLTSVLKANPEGISAYLAVLGFVAEDGYVVIAGDDGWYDVIDPEDDEVKLKIVPATQVWNA